MLLNLCFLLQSLLFPWVNNNHYQMHPLEKLNNKINTVKYDEINPVISKDGKTIYFTRVGYPDFNRTLIDNYNDLSLTLSYAQYQKELNSIFQSLTNKPVSDASKSRFNQDIWIASWSNGDFNKIDHPDYPLNSALPNSVCSLTPELNELVIINEYYQDGSMYKGFSTTKLIGNGNWSFPTPLLIYDYHNLSDEVNLNMSEDGSIIIMAIKREDSKGANDLYVSHRISDNTYSKPESIGSVINTIYQESTPYISRDGLFLYFSSNRPDGYGGSDIYVSKRLDNTWSQWSEPTLLPPPINSVYDDSQPYVNEATGYIYFTSRRDGSSDIFRTLFHPVVESNRNKTLVIHVFNSLTGKALDSDIKYQLTDSTQLKGELKTSEGLAYFTFIKGSSIKITAARSGFTDETIQLNLSDYFNNEQSVADINIFLDPISKEEKFTASNIYFIQSTSIIKDDSYDALNQIMSVLIRRQDIKMKIFGHTDNVGEEKSLIKLSTERANAIKNYLVKKGGIDPNRIEAIGLGRSQPLNDNSTEEKKAKNRRVEFVMYK
ncbi:MAG: OmpA family protein [Saprospiraceae bacterium]|nr:OmpA family protein [Saprospiraceae bacterium]MCA0334720.1 OmpA family protein [Bacteroidota bacterium]MCB0603939.1 OmpA family protein [Saprospiraceae bacterium]MCO5276415.1 OmpA family protein [Saprospiraceae bacterium]